MAAKQSLPLIGCQAIRPYNARALMGQAFVPVLAAQQKKGRAKQPFFPASRL